MAEHNGKQPGIQPPEDFYGRPREARHEDEEERDEQATVRREHHEHERHARAIDPAERTPGTILDEIPDGDGPRSDAGTNPLPDTYWSSYPDGKPDQD